MDQLPSAFKWKFDMNFDYEWNVIRWRQPYNGRYGSVIMYSRNFRLLSSCALQSQGQDTFVLLYHISLVIS